MVNGQLLNFEVVSLIDGVFSMTDRETGTLWTHLDGKSLSGPLNGERLKFLPMQIITWQEWQDLYPHTTVLDWNTGFESRYRPITPGASVGNDADFNDSRLPVNALLIGVESNNEFKVYPHQLIERDGNVVNDSLGGTAIAVFRTPNGGSGLAYDEPSTTNNSRLNYRSPLSTSTKTLKQALYGTQLGSPSTGLSKEPNSPSSHQSQPNGTAGPNTTQPQPSTALPPTGSW